MTEENNDLPEKDVERIAEALYKKMRTKQEKEMEEKLEKEKGSKPAESPYAACIGCGKGLSETEYHQLTECPRCGNKRAVVITK